MKEEDQFLKDIEPEEKTTEDAFDTPEVSPEIETGVVVEKKNVAIENEEDNREARRAKRALREERQASSFLAEQLAKTNERLDRVVDAKSAVNEGGEDLKGVEKIYGTDSPEALAATELLKSALQGVEKRAIESALETFRKEQQEAQKELKNEENNLNSMLEDLEDNYDVDLSSPKSEETRKAFFKRLEKLSPKDGDGNILHFADHRAVWEDLQSQIQKKPENRAKDLSARSMVNSTSSDSKLQDDSATKWLKDNGIL